MCGIYSTPLELRFTHTRLPPYLFSIVAIALCAAGAEWWRRYFNGVMKNKGGV